MRTSFKALIPCLAASLLVCSCNDVMDDKADIDSKYTIKGESPTVSISEVQVASYGTAVTVASTVSDVSNVIEEGVMVATDAAFSDAKYAVADTVTADYSLTVEDLEGETSYYVKSYVVTRNWEIIYGDAQSFTTPEANPWTAQYVGDYTYTVFFADADGNPQVDSGLTLWVSAQDANTYKISNWGMGTDFTFSFQADGSILVADQAIGYEYGSYGMVMVGDLVTYTQSTKYGVSGYDSETGTFTFAVVYYVEAGNLGYGYETFQITDQAVKARVDAAQRKAMGK